MAFSEDLSVFFNSDDFAESVTYTPDGGSSTTIKVLWSEGNADIDIGEIGVEAVSPRCLAKADDVADAAENDTIERNSITYYISEPPRPTDDSDTVELVLEKE